MGGYLCPYEDYQACLDTSALPEYAKVEDALAEKKCPCDGCIFLALHRGVKRSPCSTHVGLEPTTPGLHNVEVRCAIHCASELPQRASGGQVINYPKLCGERQVLGLARSPSYAHRFVRRTMETARGLRSAFCIRGGRDGAWKWLTVSRASN